eukprot:m.67586 g.67586  ORF g.67586 m.67586 type:complete len:69 (-) comp11581_c0_seq4:110-316(-)
MVLAQGGGRDVFDCFVYSRLCIRACAYVLHEQIQMMIIGHSERLDAIEHELEDQNEQQQLKKRKKKRK